MEEALNEWSIKKSTIVKKYAAAYSTIMNKQKKKWAGTVYYIDAFAGCGLNRSKQTGESIESSVYSIVNEKKYFDKYILIEKDKERYNNLRNLLKEFRGKKNIDICNGNCVKILPEILEKVQSDYRNRALCFLDPYGVTKGNCYPWTLVCQAGKKHIDLIINFPMMGVNRAILSRNPKKITDEGRKLFELLWGDKIENIKVYKESNQINLPFDDTPETSLEKMDNDSIVSTYRSRLKTHAKFKCVSKPYPFKNQKRGTIYYLMCASNNATAAKIFQDIGEREIKKN